MDAHDLNRDNLYYTRCQVRFQPCQITIMIYSLWYERWWDA